MHKLLPLATLAALAACGPDDTPRRSVAGPAIGSTATSGPYLSPEGAHDINRDYRIGADPNFPGGMAPSSRGVR
jgi:uncharacterized lipoprotein